MMGDLDVLSLGRTNIIKNKVENISTDFATALQHLTYHATFSDTLKYSGDTERTQTNSWAVEKKFTTLIPGEHRIKFDCYQQDYFTTAGQYIIYVNGVVVGSGSYTDSWTTFTYDLNLSPGDYVEVAINSIAAGPTAHIKNFRVYYTVEYGE